MSTLGEAWAKIGKRTTTVDWVERGAETMMIGSWVFGLWPSPVWVRALVCAAWWIARSVVVRRLTEEAFEAGSEFGESGGAAERRRSLEQVIEDYARYANHPRVK